MFRTCHTCRTLDIGPLRHLFALVSPAPAFLSFPLNRSASRVLRLEPIRRSAGTVCQSRRLLTILEAELADVLEAGRTVFLDVAFEPNGQGQNLPISAMLLDNQQR